MTTKFIVAARAAYAGAQSWGVVWGGDAPGSTALGAGPGTDLGLRGAIIMQQRAAFCQALVHEPDTLLFDNASTLVLGSILLGQIGSFRHLFGPYSFGSFFD